MTSESSTKLYDWIFLLREWTVLQTQAIRTREECNRLKREVKHVALGGCKTDEDRSDDDNANLPDGLQLVLLSGGKTSSQHLDILVRLQRIIDLLQTTLERIQIHNRASANAIWNVGMF